MDALSGGIEQFSNNYSRLSLVHVVRRESRSFCSFKIPSFPQLEWKSDGQDRIRGADRGVDRETDTSRQGLYEGRKRCPKVESAVVLKSRVISPSATVDDDNTLWALRLDRAAPSLVRISTSGG
ncbi:hypothetical protein KM043_001516 [Ampulex compressa]|nr:hypothetical protein KM043_001516 [Ampulex compressa]